MVVLIVVVVTRLTVVTTILAVVLVNWACGMKGSLLLKEDSGSIDATNDVLVCPPSVPPPETVVPLPTLSSSPPKAA